MVAAVLALSAQPPEGVVEHPSIAASIRDGLRFVRSERALLGSFGIDLAAMTFGMPRTLFPVLSLTVYHTGAAGTGALFAAVSAGATVAALTTGWLHRVRRLGLVVIWAVLAWGVAIALAGLVATLWAAMALLALAGAADSISAVCRSTINQTVTPDAMRGRMSAAFSLVVTSGPRAGRHRVGQRRLADHPPLLGLSRRDRLHRLGAAGRPRLPRPRPLRRRAGDRAISHGGDRRRLTATAARTSGPLAPRSVRA